MSEVKIIAQNTEPDTNNLWLNQEGGVFICIIMVGLRL